MNLLNTAGIVIFTAAVDTVKELLVGAVKVRVNLRGANLRGANLRGANLRGANLREADLREADLREADLREADLREANLYGADLCGANLREANLYGANLCEANLYGAKGEKKTIAELRIFSSSLYPYAVQAVLFEDGERWIRMGCLWKSLKEYDRHPYKQS